MSRLTRVPAVTLRMWERRHSVVEPLRTDSGGRRYTQAHLDRLMLIKRAIDAGFAISTLAPLDDEAIEDRLSSHADAGRVAIQHRPVVAVLVGKPHFLDGMSSAAGTDCEVRQHVADLDQLDGGVLGEDGDLDVVIVEADLITPTFIRDLSSAQERLGGLAAVVVYQFGTRAHRKLLESSSCTLMPGPASPDTVLTVCRSLLAMGPDADDGLQLSPLSMRVPDRLFSAGDLRLLAEQSSAVKCECPEHLATLVERLSAFEAYSAHCESVDAADEALHRMLHAVTAQSRRALEDALLKVVEHERIEWSGPSEAGREH